MCYQPFCMSRIGASHIRCKLPCQDASVGEVYQNACIAVVADGHGSRRHFRSDRGSAIACQAAMEKICVFLDESELDDWFMDDQLSELKQAICDAWIAAVRADFENDPWTDEELAEQRALLTEEQFARLADGSDAAIAYGSTICAAFTYAGGWAAIQLGDGCFVKIDPDGTYDWPMPESLVNEGNKTASLCMRDPMRDFRHCSGSDRPAGLLVYTDGIEKTFPSQGKEVVSLLHWIWRNERGGAPEREDSLARTLDTLTMRSAIGDDVSVAGIVNMDAEDVEPVLGMAQKRQELEQLNAQITEIEGTIRFNGQRLLVARENEADVRSGAVEQLESVIKRKQAAVEPLRERAVRLRIELGIPEPEWEREAALFQESDTDLPSVVWENRIDKEDDVTLKDVVDTVHESVRKSLEKIHRFWKGKKYE